MGRTAYLWILPVLAGCSGELQGQNAGTSGASNEGAGTGSSSGGNGSLSPGSNAGSGASAEEGGNNPPAGNANGFVASESEARRLSRAELNNTLRDLLGDTTGPANQFLPEDQFSPYDNNYRFQSASAALIDSLEGLASDVAKRVVADTALRAAIVPCTPMSAGDATCFRQVAESLLQRGFRRPVATEEVDRYMTLLDFATEDNPAVPHDFYTAVELLIRSILQDPEFLYRVEIGTPTAQAGLDALNDYEIASRLSYLLTGSMPSQDLLDAAAAGKLSSIAERQNIAAQLLASDAAKAQVRRFHSMWLGYRAIPQDAQLVAAFDQETSALIDRVVFDEPQDYMNLFTFGETYIDSFLADHYGLPEPPGGGPAWVSYGSSGRAGILSHGSVLSAFGKFSDTSPTQRGIFVRTRLMCETVQPPPPNVASDKPPVTTDPTACKVDRYEQHRTNAACSACHEALDPIGFGLENYNLSGQWRATDDDNPTCAIMGQGEVKPYGTFSGPKELAQLLIDNGKIDDCLVKQWVSFAVGRPLLPEESAPTAALLTSFRSSHHSLQQLLLSYVADPAFALKLEPAPAP